MMRMFGQEDKELAESIQREEELAKFFFKESAPEPELVVESSTINEVIVPTPEPAPAFTPPTTNTVVDVVNVLKSANVANANTNVYRDKEMEGMRKTIAEMMQKISTMSWGGGGTGIVRIYDADDLDRSSVQNGRYMTYRDGVFLMDEINPYEIIHNTTLVTTNTYVVQDTDYYIGVNCAEPVTIIIPSDPSSGREIIVKDESGNCETYNITVSGPVDNDANGFILAVNNGAVHMLFRGDYWRII